MRKADPIFPKTQVEQLTAKAGVEEHAYMAVKSARFCILLNHTQTVKGRHDCYVSSRRGLSCGILIQRLKLFSTPS